MRILSNITCYTRQACGKTRSHFTKYLPDAGNRRVSE